MSKGLKKREEIEKKDTWAMEDLFESDKAWEEAYVQLKDSIGKLETYKGKLAESWESLLGCLQCQDALSEKMESIYVYANQKSHEDLTNALYQSMAGRAQSLYTGLYSAGAYFEPEILAIPQEKIRQFMGQCEELRQYERKLEEIYRTKEHTLDAKTEELLANMSEIMQGPDDIFTLFNNADLQFPVIKGEEGEEVQITHGRYISLLESSDARVRKDAFMGLYHTYEKFKNTLGATYSASVKQDVFIAKTRNYSSAREMALDGSHIPVSVYDNLIETVRAHLPSMYRYVKLRKKALCVEELHMYDLYTPMVPQVEYKVDFSQAKEMVKAGLAPMGEAYMNVLQEGFDNRWIDVYENQGKKSGAYSWGAYGTHPYVLLNYNGSLNHVFTLAHEMGHALHSYFSDKNQPYTYAGYRIFVAEVASTCNESLLIHYLLKEAEKKEEKAYLINYFLEQFRGTLFRQTMFAEFEKITHEMVERGEALTSENMCEIYYKLNQDYFGDGMVIDKEIALEWARIPHFYNAFYVYQYATGFSAAIALSKRILKEGEAAVADYMKFLSGGSAKDAIDLLKMAGVDMSKKEPVEAALAMFDELLGEMEKLMEE